MNLWTEYEGATIDSAFALTKLVQTEGRSAFFSTRNANGESVLIRIIECHFDEDEILARWRGVQTLGHPNFLRIDRFGQFQVEPENTTAAYAVFERVEANLGEVLERGRLSAADATQIGLSVCSALETLHASGFVHEHVEARNIYAVGDKVKLRSDCIRETPEGEAGIAARRRDIHDLAVVFRQVLLGAWAPRHAVLTSPFDEIVRNGMDGTWGLTEIKEALGKRDVPKTFLRRSASPEPVPAKPAPVVGPTASTAASTVSAAKNEEFSALPLPFDKFVKPESAAERPAAHASDSAKHADLPGQKPDPMDVPVIFGISERDFNRWRTAGALLLGVIVVAWMLAHHWSGGSAGAADRVSAQPTVASTQADPSARADLAMPAARGSAAAPALKDGSQPGVQWRVVAFTYRRQDQAQKKASSLAQEHPGLSPAVFSPNGRAPWLVTIGGGLQRDAAYALARKARSLGLPRDTYAQNYKVR